MHSSLFGQSINPSNPVAAPAQPTPPQRSSYLGGDGEGVRAGDLPVKEVVEEVAGGAVDEEPEHGELEHALEVHLVGLVDELLRQKVARGEADEGGQRLGEERLVLEQLVVALPEGHQRVVPALVPVAALAAAAAAAAWMG